MNGSNNQIIFENGVKLSNVCIEIDAQKCNLYIGKSTNIKESTIKISETVNTSKIKIGNNVEVEKFEFLMMAGENQKVDIGDNLISQGMVMRCAENNGRIKVGNNCLFSFGVVIMNSDTHPIYDLYTHQRINQGGEVEIGDRVWCGNNVSISKNVKLNNDVIIGRNSLVTKSFSESNMILAGVSANIIKRNIYWELSF